MSVKSISFQTHNPNSRTHENRKDGTPLIVGAIPPNLKILPYHEKAKNLSSQTMRYYAEDLKYFHACVPVQYVDEVSQDAFENFIVLELDAGKKITSLNSRIRGLRVFFKFCAERE